MALDVTVVLGQIDKVLSRQNDYRAKAKYDDLSDLGVAVLNSYTTGLPPKSWSS